MGAIKCIRCNGLMIHDTSVDECDTVYSLRCLNCGRYVDPTFRVNMDLPLHHGGLKRDQPGKDANVPLGPDHGTKHRVSGHKNKGRSRTTT